MKHRYTLKYSKDYKMPNNLKDPKDPLKGLAPLLGQDKMEWEVLEEYLKALHKQTLMALVAAPSELEVYRLQGKAGLLEILLKLKDNFKEMKKNGT
jgi:hypothetical protein